MNTVYNTDNVEARFADTVTLARRFSVSVRQIQKWTSAGILPVHKLGRRCIRYDVAKCDLAVDSFQTRAACIGRKGGQD